MRSLVFQNDNASLNVEFKVEALSNNPGTPTTVMDVVGNTSNGIHAGLNFAKTVYKIQDFIDKATAMNLKLISQAEGESHSTLKAIATALAVTTSSLADATKGANESCTVACIGEGSVKESDKFTMLAKASMTGGDFFVFSYDATHYAAVWFDKNGDSTTDLPSGTIFTAATVKIRVDISSISTAIQIGTATYTALGLNATVAAACDLTDNGDGSVQIVSKTYIAVFAAPAAYAKAEGSVGGRITPTRTATGHASTLSGTYFNISTHSTNYYVWYSVTGASSVDPAPGGKTAIPVTITRSMSATQVGDATAVAIAASGSGLLFSAADVTGTITVTDLTKETATDGSAGTSGFVVIVVTQGVAPIVYSATLAATGGSFTSTIDTALPVVWSISTGTLPAGLSLNAATGVISGTCTDTIGSKAFTVKVTDFYGGTATADLTILVKVS